MNFSRQNREVARRGQLYSEAGRIDPRLGTSIPNEDAAAIPRRDDGKAQCRFAGPIELNPPVVMTAQLRKIENA